MHRSGCVTVMLERPLLLVSMTGLEHIVRRLWVGQSQPRSRAERRHCDPQQPFTPRLLPCVVQRPLDQIASVPATGQFASFDIQNSLPRSRHSDLPEAGTFLRDRLGLESYV
jgi:hypothetical protein